MRMSNGLSTEIEPFLGLVVLSWSPDPCPIFLVILGNFRRFI